MSIIAALILIGVALFLVLGGIWYDPDDDGGLLIAAFVSSFVVLFIYIAFDTSPSTNIQEIQRTETVVETYSIVDGLEEDGVFVEKNGDYYEFYFLDGASVKIGAIPTDKAVIIPSEGDNCKIEKIEEKETTCKKLKFLYKKSTGTKIFYKIFVPN